MRADKNPSFLIVEVVEVVEVVFFIVGLLVELNLIVMEIVYSTAGECKGGAESCALCYNRAAQNKLRPKFREQSEQAERHKNRHEQRIQELEGHREPFEQSRCLHLFDSSGLSRL